MIFHGDMLVYQRVGGSELVKFYVVCCSHVVEMTGSRC